MSDGGSLNMGEVNVSESETILTKVPNFAKGDVAIAFHVICQERVGVQEGRAWNGARIIFRPRTATA